MAKTPLTVSGAQQLKTELHRMKTVDRPAVIQAIADARSHGDLSENAEYTAAKERQSFLEGRIAEVEAKLANAQIIDPKLVDAEGRCVFGSTVELEDVASSEVVTYQIVGEDEADIKQGKISITSPIARALIGKYADDQVEVQTPGGVRTFEIVDVRYEYPSSGRRGRRDTSAGAAASRRSTRTNSKCRAPLAVPGRRPEPCRCAGRARRRPRRRSRRAGARECPRRRSSRES